MDGFFMVGIEAVYVVCQGESMGVRLDGLWRVAEIGDRDGYNGGGMVGWLIINQIIRLQFVEYFGMMNGDMMDVLYG